MILHNFIKIVEFGARNLLLKCVVIRSNELVLVIFHSIKLVVRVLKYLFKILQPGNFYIRADQDTPVFQKELSNSKRTFFSCEAFFDPPFFVANASAHLKNSSLASHVCMSSKNQFANFFVIIFNEVIIA